MKIKYMLNSPKDMKLLYSQSEEICDVLGEPKTITIETFYYKEYSEKILTDVKLCVLDLTEYSYKGSIERIAHEVYQVTINKNEYKVAFVFDTRNEVQLHI